MTTELALEAAGQLELRELFLSDHRVKLGKGFDPMRVYNGTTVNVVYGPRESHLQTVSLDDDRKILRWILIYGARIRLINGVFESVDFDSLAEEDLLVEIDVSFQLLAFVRSEEIEHDALEAFANRNVKHLVWPYLREWLQNICARTRLPMAVLDFSIPPPATDPVTRPSSPED